MHWASILTALVLAAASAWLVIVGKWEVWEAFGVMGVTAIALITGLALLLVAISPPEGRRLLLDEIWRTTRNDLRDLLRLFRFK